MGKRISALLNGDIMTSPRRIDEDTQLRAEDQFVVVDSSTAAVAVTLPPKAVAAGKFYMVHAPSGGTNDVSVNDKEAATEVTGGDLDAANDYGLWFCTGYAWQLIASSLPDIGVQPSAKTQTITVTATAINDFAELVLLDTASGALASTLAAPAAGRFLVISQIDTGTDGHTVTLAAGTFDGTNEIATFNAGGESLVLYGVSATRFLVVENIGAVALSTAG